MEQQPAEQQTDLFAQQNLYDGMAAVFAIGGAVVAAATQSVAVAAFPLAGAVGLHIFNRRQLMDKVTNHYETMIRQQNLHIVNHQNSLKTLSDQLHDFQSEVSVKIDDHALDTQQKFANQAENIGQLHQITRELSQFGQLLQTRQQQLTEVVEQIQPIENVSHAPENSPKSADMYYQRGLSFQQSGDKQGAIADFTAAIQLDPSHARAYQKRSMLLAELGDRQSAVDDLRQSAKFYFEMGDLSNYQQMRALAKELYDHEITLVSSPTESPSKETVKPIFSEQILVGSLFDSN